MNSSCPLQCSSNLVAWPNKMSNLTQINMHQMLLQTLAQMSSNTQAHKTTELLVHKEPYCTFTLSKSVTDIKHRTPRSSSLGCCLDSCCVILETARLSTAARGYDNSGPRAKGKYFLFQWCCVLFSLLNAAYWSISMLDPKAFGYVC